MVSCFKNFKGLSYFHEVNIKIKKTALSERVIRNEEGTEQAYKRNDKKGDF
ncbi:hypothetical protein SAMN05878482_107224 [Peribacillus simplex]|uniref:Uncharacterized protein n=1 Tax=Peribacillus simplex TaxID=1478 RepID=A0A9X8RCY7_9BACI|nr:hypothetical protein SAMN05878482_107224 [Peribacillus simplex]